MTGAPLIGDAAGTEVHAARVAAAMRADDFAPSDTAGPRHVELALRDLEFPLSRAALLQRAGDWRVPLDGARSVPLRELLADVRKDEFRSARDVADALR